MYSLVVLGQVPGTSITISFTMWVELCAVGIMLFVWAYVHKNTPSSAELAPSIGTDDTTVLQLTAR